MRPRSKRIRRSSARSTDSGSSSGGAFAYPADGSLVSAQTTTASAATSVQRFGSSSAPEFSAMKAQLAQCDLSALETSLSGDHGHGDAIAGRLQHAVNGAGDFAIIFDQQNCLVAGHDYPHAWEAGRPGPIVCSPAGVLKSARAD